MGFISIGYVHIEKHKKGVIIVFFFYMSTHMHFKKKTLALTVPEERKA